MPRRFQPPELWRSQLRAASPEFWRWPDGDSGMADPIPCPKCGRLYVWDGTRCCRKECRYGSNKKPRKLRVRVVGVYPGEAAEPVHLVEILIEGGAADAFDLGEVTQEMADTPRMNWQAPYDDRVISETDGKARV